MDVNEFLTKIDNAKIVSPDQMRQMRVISTGSTLADKPKDGFLDDLDNPSHGDDSLAVSDSETPRLVRGFHDVLISIGLVAALFGLWFITGPLIALIAILIATEFFVLRQKLALPAFILTGFVGAGIIHSFEYLGSSFTRSEAAPFIIFLSLAIAMGLYYWRYKIPVALASLITAAFATLFAFLLFLIEQQYGSSVDFFKNNARLIGGIGLVLTVLQFTVAMWFDSKDPKRLTRNSDVAFWLHLTLAPLLMYSMFLLLFGSSGFWWSTEPSASDAIIALGVVTLLMAIGIIIDRRAFVTSGLISLGVALYILSKDTGITATNISALSLLGVGVIVLLLGTGWQSLRAIVLKLLPLSLREKLPPVTSD